MDTIQYVINNIFHSTLRASPSKILLGIEQRNNADVELVDFLKKVVNAEFDFQENRSFSHELAIEATNKSKEYNKIYDERHKKLTKYKEGDLVMILDTTLAWRR